MPKATGPSQTEIAIERQPGILGLDWTERVPAKARAAIKGAKAVTFIGTGTSYHCALWAQWLAREASGGKLPARAVTSWDWLVAEAKDPAPRTQLFVVISHRGDRSLSHQLLTALKGRRHVLICAEEAPVGSHPAIRTSPIETSQAHTMSLVGAMGACSELIARLLPARAASELRARRELAAICLQRFTEDHVDIEEAIGGIITRGAGLHFIGGGPFHAIAHELALKAREIIHVPAHAYNIEEFLHGPLASVNEDDTVIALERGRAARGAKKMAPLDRLLWHERLASCRQAAEAVGCLVLEPSLAGDLEREAARLGPSWQSLLMLAWGQLLCLSTAKAWDINPDLNRRDDPRYDDAYRRAQL